MINLIKGFANVKENSTVPLSMYHTSELERRELVLWPKILLMF
jgi:hypothetical protein